MSTRGVRYRRSPYLVSYWSDGQLIFHNYASGDVATASPLATAILHSCTGWRTANALFEEMPQFSRSSVERALERLVRTSLLERSDRRYESAMENWASWNPAAGFFHFSTKDVSYDESASEGFFKWRLRTKPMPETVKRYSNNKAIPLPPSRAAEPFSRVLLERRTWRRFSRRPMTSESLATLLGLTFGVHRWLDSGKLGRMPLKTSPSGGARHPIEAYVLVRRVEGVKSGIYHYGADRHCLTPLKPRASSRTIASYLPGQPWYRGASTLVLMTAVFPRTEWQYPYPRSYRTVLFEAGHFCQTFCLVATALGLAPFCTDALNDSRIERDLGIDGVEESVLYAAGAGTRPAEEWTPWPVDDGSWKT